METRDRYKPFNYLTSEKARVYRAVMHEFIKAKAAFALALRPAEIVEALGRQGLVDPSDPDGLNDELEQLRKWGNLESQPDTTDVATVEDFYRRRFLYQMSAAGEAVESAVEVFEEHLQKPGELQTAALSDIEANLRELLVFAEAPRLDSGKIHRTLRELVNRFTELTNEAQSFIGGLQRTIDLHGMSMEQFQEYKKKLIDYLERFIGALAAAASEIAELLLRIERHDLDALLLHAARRDVADAFDPGPDALEGAREKWRLHWVGLRAWFVKEAGRPCQSDLLRARARSAIPALLTAVQSINDQRQARSDRTADLKTLARWFATCTSERDAHRLWRAAFSLAPARHLRIDDRSLAAREDTPVSPRTSWLAADPIHINMRMRETGRFTRKGRQNRVINRTEAKRKLALLIGEEASQVRQAKARLANGRRMRLSEIERLDRLEFQLFLDLLGEALSRKLDPGAACEATSADGSLRIRMEPTAEGELATIHTTTGRFSGPDHFVTIRDLVSRVERSVPVGEPTY